MIIALIVSLFLWNVSTFLGYFQGVNVSLKYKCLVVDDLLFMG